MRSESYLTSGAYGFFFNAVPTARKALGLPIDIAKVLYVATFPAQHESCNVMQG